MKRVTARKINFLKHPKTIGIVRQRLSQITAARRIRIVKAVNNCIEHPETRSAFMDTLPLVDKKQVGVILSLISGNKLRESHFLQE